MTTEVELFRRGKEILGKHSGGLIARLWRAKGRNINATMALIEAAAKKENPREWIGRVLNPAEQQSYRKPTTLDGGDNGEFYRV